MANKKSKREKDGVLFTPAETAWNCFKGTGLLSYYLLYKKLDDNLDDK
jgi:hypothetical protein